jgi:hypothetical protein
MAKERDWVDYTNTAANVVQVAQLANIQNKIGSASAALSRQHANAEMQAKWRQFLAENERMLDETRRSLDAGEAVGAYAVASLIKYHFTRLKVSTALFTDWADIDRTNSIVGKLGVLLADASKQVALREDRAQRWDALFGGARCDKVSRDP